MGEKTSIAWTDHTFNPWRGCQKVSEGCRNCYAEAQSVRSPKVLGEWGPDGRRVLAAESYWRQPLKWDRDAAKAGVRRRVFCGSLMDVFENRPELVESRLRLFRLIQDTPNLTWLLLTKRPENFQKCLREATEHVRREAGKTTDFSWWISDWRHGRTKINGETHPPNVWVGTSVEDQAAATRLHHLAEIPARVKFVSAEPLLGPLVLSGWDGKHQYNWLDPKHPRGVSWVIVGGESGPNARPCDVAWVGDLVSQCRAAGVACFVKQLGAVPTCLRHLGGDGWPEHVEYRKDTEATNILRLCDRKGGDPAEWPPDLRVREFPGVKP